MLFVSTFCFLMCLTGSTGKRTIKEELLESIALFCTLTDTCSGNSSQRTIKTDETEKPCCLSCSCSQNCHYHGNCCPDYESNMAPEVLPVCSVLSFSLSEYTRLLISKYSYKGIVAYNLLSDCPRSFLDAEIVTKCRKDPSTLEEFLTVSDENGIVYKNRYCAECHGIKLFTEWNVNVECPTTISTETLDLSTNFLGTACMLTSVPPEPVTVEDSKCFWAVHTCNVTGKWDNYDPSIEAACGQYTLYYTGPLHSSDGRTAVYKNVHCFMCNQPTEIELAQICPVYPDADDTKRDGLLVNFFGVINPHSLGLESRSTRGLLCPLSQIYDPYFNICRTIRCPSYQFEKDGRCLNRFLWTHGYAITLWSRIVYSPRNSTVFANENILRKSAARMDETLINMPEVVQNGCRLCSFALMIGPDIVNNPHLMAETRYYTSENCGIRKLNTLLNKFYSRLDKRIVINFQNDVVSFHIDVEIREESLSDYELVRAQGDQVCAAPKNFANRLPCPYITINEEEVSLVIRKSPINITNSAFVRKSLDKARHTNVKYDICYKYYLSFASHGESLFGYQGVSVRLLLGAAVLISTLFIGDI